MPRAEASVTINAPIEKVFDVIADYGQLAQYAPVSEVTNIKGNPGEKGSSADYTYHVLGIKFTMHTTMLEAERPRKVTTEETGGLSGKFEWTLEPQGQATKVNVRIDYTVPGGVLGKIANRLLLERMNQKNMDTMAHGLKIYCEA